MKKKTRRKREGHFLASLLIFNARSSEVILIKGINVLFISCDLWGDTAGSISVFAIEETT